MGLTDEDVNKVVHLGKKEPRPLLLQFGSRMAKTYAMESARLLVRQFDSDGNELRRVQLLDDMSPQYHSVESAAGMSVTA